MVRIWRMKRSAFVIAGLGLVGLSYGTIFYQVEVTPGAAGLIVTMDIPQPGVSVAVVAPRWAPGSYRYADYGKNIAGLSAKSGSKMLDVTYDNDSTWTIQTGGADRVRVSYLVKGAVGAETHHYSGPATYLYVRGRKEESCWLKLNKPSSWQIATGLDATGANEFKADDYDVLADNPVSLGHFTRDRYVSHGVPHEIVYHRGPVEMVDRAKTMAACKMVSEAQYAFFGGFPMRKYVWHFSVTPNIGGAGGLEHLSSTQISLAAGLSLSTVSVLSHEYFHLWNVKRIRSSVLGPFDYQTLPKTGALWWLEGVTDYYADVFLWRGRYSTLEEHYGSILQNVRTVRANAQRMNVSPYDASYRVSEAANGRGNSQGFGVSYYPTGWVAGLCLDIELLSRTSGKYRLDDVEKALWKECMNNQPGFEETRIRELLIQFGGSGMGAVYDQWIMKPGELPVEAQLAKLGLEMAEVDETYGDPGALMSAVGGGRVIVRSPVEGSPFMSADQVMSIGSVKIGGLHITEVAKALELGQTKFLSHKPVSVTVLRDGKTVTFNVTATQKTRKKQVILETKGATSAQKRLRATFLAR